MAEEGIAISMPHQTRGMKEQAACFESEQRQGRPQEVIDRFEGMRRGDAEVSALRQRIEDLTRKGIDAANYLVDLNLKLAVPFASFVLACVAVPLAGRVQRHPSVAAILLTGLVVGFAYWVILGLTTSLGQSGVLPAAEMLIENYRKLREVEGILRRWSYEGETVLPDDPAPFYRVAVRCGFKDAETFQKAVQQARAAIREEYRGYFDAPKVSKERNRPGKRAPKGKKSER